MKKFYMLMVALLCGAAAMAETYENEIYVPDVTVKAGSSATAQICLRNTDTRIVGIAFKVSNPTGIKMATTVGKYTMVTDRLDIATAKAIMKANKKKELDNGDIDEDEYEEACEEIDAKDYADLFEIKKVGGAFTFGGIMEATAGKVDGVVKYNAFMGTDGALLTCPITVDEGVADGEYEIQLTDLIINGNPSDKGILSNLSAGHETAVVKVTVGGTGINSINAEDSKAPVYNLAGQRVSKAQQGVFIQNGKKVAVK